MQGVTGRDRRLGGIGKQPAEVGTKRIRQTDVGNTATTEEAGWSLHGAVDELRRHHHVARLQPLLKRANG